MSVLKAAVRFSLVALLGSGAAQLLAQESWLAHDKEWDQNKQRLQSFGERFATAQALYDSLKTQAKGGDTLDWSDMKKAPYDWSGVYTRTGGGLSFDPDIRADATTAKLTPAGAQARQRKIDQMAKTGGEYDPISDCRPPSFPRWATEPFLHEYVVTPKQTWLINEMVNDVRRVYTDGSAHTSAADAYASANGDTIGFWTNGMLVTHTMYLLSGQYQRGTQPDYSDKVEVVERWKKVDVDTLEADYWVYDPVNLAKPWYTRQSWTKLANDDNYLRLRYWDCRENQNNEILQKQDGTSQFNDFDFVDDDAAVSNDADVKKATEKRDR